MSQLGLLRSLGFEGSSHIPFTRQYRVVCHSCEALVIQGTPCHGAGCPEQRVECRECGCMVVRSEGCDCMAPSDDIYPECEDEFAGSDS